MSEDEKRAINHFVRMFCLDYVDARTTLKEIDPQEEDERNHQAALEAARMATAARLDEKRLKHDRVLADQHSADQQRHTEAVLNEQQAWLHLIGKSTNHRQGMGPL